MLFDFIANQTLQKADQREEKNIKRRVYDALNVLVAAEVIQKKGKEVLSWSLSFSPLESTPSKTIIEKNINLMKIN